MKRKYFFLFIFCIVFIFCILVHNNRRNTNLQTSYIKKINPEYLNYLLLDEEQQLDYEIVPSKYIITTTNLSNSQNDVYPNAYDLRDVDNKNYMSPVKNQGSRGLCWAFSTTSVMESSLLFSDKVSQNNLIQFSPYQMDFATSRNGIKNYYSYDRNLEDGWDSQLLVEYITKGLSPINNDYFNEDKYNNRPLEYDEVFNIDDMQYYFPNYYRLDSSNSKSKNDIVKEYILKYGAAYIATHSPSANNNCIFDNKVLLDTNVGCIDSGMHAMTVIGWDDNVEFNIGDKNIKGAWIVQNSWGSSLPYIYVAYESGNMEFYGYGKGELINYDNVYSQADKIIATDNKLINYFQKPLNTEEKIVRLSFSHYSQEATDYKIYISLDDDNYIYIDTITTDLPGRVSVDLLDQKYNGLVDNITNSSFSVKIITDDLARFSNNNIYVFTKNVEIDDTTFDGYIVPQNNNIYYYSKMFDVDVVANTNISKNDIELKIYDQNDLLINDDEISFYSLNRKDKTYSFKYKINRPILTENYVVKLFYNNELLDTSTLNIESLEPISNYGDGTSANPFVITRASEFAKISTNPLYYSFNYKLGGSIDLTDYPNLQIGTKENPFTGTFDGNGYIISNYNISTKSSVYSGLFNYTKKAKIHNIILKNFNSSISDSGLLIGKDYSSEVYDIYILNGIINDTGSASLISNAEYGTYYKIYSNATINSQFSGGLFGKLYNSSVSFAVFNGIINTFYIASNISFDIKNSYIDYIDISSTSNITKDYEISEQQINNSIFDNICINININKEYYFTGNLSGSSINNVYIIDDNKYKEINKGGEDNLYSGILNVEKNDNNIYQKLDLDDKYWEYHDNYPRLKYINYNIDEVILPGVSNIYKFDTENMIIYNVRIPSGTQKLTRRHFIDNFTIFNGKIFSPDGSIELINDEDIITTATIVKIDNYIYRVAITGNIYDSTDDVSNIDVADSSAGLRILARLPLNIYNLDYSEIEKLTTQSADLNCDGKFDIADVTLLRRWLAEFPNSVAIYESEGKSCYEYSNGDLR